MLVCPRAFSPYLMIEYLFIFWNVLFCLYCFILSRYPFSVPSLASILWFISPCCIVCFNYWVTFFFSKCFSFLPLSNHFRLLFQISYLLFQSNVSSRCWISVCVLGCFFDCYFFVVHFSKSVLVFQFLVCRLLYKGLDPFILYLLWYISNVLRSENQLINITDLPWSTSLWLLSKI